MKKEQLEGFKAWFDRFVAGFYGDDKYVNVNIKMKEDHSRRVCGEMLYLADELALGGNQRLLAETIALFHDVGRFPQFIKYRTYNDQRSVNHCLLALDVLTKGKVLLSLPADEREIIETAIKSHGDKELAGDLTGDTLMLSKMIRDADKLDIYSVFTQACSQQRDNPADFLLEIEFPDEPRYTPEVLESILSGQRIDYKKLQTFNDMKLCVLGWVYDVNFPATLKRIKQRRRLEAIFDYLPDNEDIAKVREKIFTYVNDRIASGR